MVNFFYCVSTTVLVYGFCEMVVVVLYRMMGTGWVASLTLEGRKVTVLLTNNHVLGKLETACSADTEYQFAYLYKNSEMNPAVIYGDKLIPNNPKDFYTCGQQDRVSVWELCGMA